MTALRTSLWGFPSTTAKPVPMPGTDSAVARMMAHATRCVNDSFSERPAAFRSELIWRRCASSAVTATVRKLVAVGIVRLSSMYPASAAAGPRRITASSPATEGAAATGAGALAPAGAARASGLRMIPPGPVPVIAAGSTPFSRASRRATGVIWGHSTPAAAVEWAAGAAAAGAAAAGAAGAAAPSEAGPAPDSISPSGMPTVNVSPAGTEMETIRPAAGLGTSRSTLSVETSTTI